MRDHMILNAYIRYNPQHRPHAGHFANLANRKPRLSFQLRRCKQFHHKPQNIFANSQCQTVSLKLKSLSANYADSFLIKDGLLELVEALAFVWTTKFL